MTKKYLISDIELEIIGNFFQSCPILVEHPNSNRIFIQGYRSCCATSPAKGKRAEFFREVAKGSEDFQRSREHARPDQIDAMAKSGAKYIELDRGGDRGIAAWQTNA